MLLVAAACLGLAVPYLMIRRFEARLSLDLVRCSCACSHAECTDRKLPRETHEFGGPDSLQKTVVVAGAAFESANPTEGLAPPSESVDSSRND